MAGNPLPNFGSLNRVLQSVNWTNFQALNVTAEFVGEEGIRLGLEGEATDQLPVNVGTVTSPAVYQPCTLMIPLVKTLPIVAVYKTQYELDGRLGPCVARTDSTGLPPYDLFNMTMSGIHEMSFNGKDPNWVVVLRGYYLVNSSLFD
jgi:hypothetical protein